MTDDRVAHSFWSAARVRLRALRNIPALLKLVWEAGPGVITAGILLRLLTALIPVALLAITRLIIDAIVALTHHHPLPHHFWWLVGAEFALACLSALLARLIDYSDNLLADKYTRKVSVGVMEHASHLDLATYEDPAFYDKLERARVQATDRLVTIQMMGQLLQQSITTATFAASILYYSPWLLLILVLCVIPAFVGESHFAFAGYALNFAQTPIRRQLDYLRVLGASKESAKELKLFRLSHYLTDRFAVLSDVIYRQNVSLARRKLLAGSFLSVLTTAGYYTAYIVVIYHTVTGAISIGTLTFLTGAIAGASSNIQMVFSTFSGIADQALFLKDLIEFFATQPRLPRAAHPLPAPRPIKQGFEFRGVTFAYPGGSRPVLYGLDLVLEPGRRTALIGENGQGKTTLVKLLTRLYDPTEGQILLDGVDLRDYDLEDLSGEIGVIFQDFMRYEMTATENIAVGKIEALAHAEEIRAAAVKSGADAMIQSLPMGYQQLLGRRFEGGVDLSGGEWQKLALARAYLRNAQVLILDEPTAALDARAEHEVFQRFAELTQGKTSVLISHRFSTVRMADRILVLEGGRIAEDGSHEQLMAHGGRYSEMFELQASSYR